MAISIAYHLLAMSECTTDVASNLILPALQTNEGASLSNAERRHLSLAASTILHGLTPNKDSVKSGKEQFEQQRDVTT
jgi:hypothetical protein